MVSHCGVICATLPRMPDRIDKKRDALRRYMEANRLKGSPWARSAGLSQNTVTNYLNRQSDSLSQSTWEKLAEARGMTAPQLLAAIDAHLGFEDQDVEPGSPIEAPVDERAQLEAEAFALFDAASPEVQEALLTLLRAAVGDPSASGRATRKKARS